MRVLALAALVAVTASAEPRPWHGDVAAGGALLFSGAQGDRLRLDASALLLPGSRYGVLLAWRAFDEDHRGIVTAGLAYEGAAARPRLVVALHADLGADLDRPGHPAPAAGGGIRTTLKIVGPLAAVLDLSALVVIDGVDGSRLQIGSNALVGVRF